jgi:hypothetical protein
MTVPDETFQQSRALRDVQFDLWSRLNGTASRMTHERKRNRRCSNSDQKNALFYQRKHRIGSETLFNKRKRKEQTYHASQPEETR